MPTHEKRSLNRFLPAKSELSSRNSDDESIPLLEVKLHRCFDKLLKDLKMCINNGCTESETLDEVFKGVELELKELIGTMRKLVLN